MIKKVLGIIALVMIASLSVAGCTSSTTNTTQGTASLKATQVTAPQAIGSPYTYTPKQGYKFVMFNTTVTNTASNSRNTHTLFFTLHDSNGNTYGISQATNDKSIAGYPNNVMMNPGDKVTGLLVFEIPQNANLVNMVYHDDYSSVTVNL
jgi:predicted small secreted protein